MIYITNDTRHSDIIPLRVFSVIFFDKNICLNDINALIITSKNALFALEKLNVNWKSKDIYLINKGSAKVAKRLGAKNYYISYSKNAKDFFDDIKGKINEKLVLYAKGAKSTLDISSYKNIKSNILYDTQLNKLDKSLKPPKNSIIIITSVFAYECFCANFGWDDSYKVVALSERIANHIKGECFVAKDVCIETAIKLAKQISHAS